MRDYIVINEERVWLNDQDNIWMYRPEYAHSVRDTKLMKKKDDSSGNITLTSCMIRVFKTDMCI